MNKYKNLKNKSNTDRFNLCFWKGDRGMKSKSTWMLFFHNDNRQLLGERVSTCSHVGFCETSAPDGYHGG